jgi:hypothetical protein
MRAKTVLPPETSFGSDAAYRVPIFGCVRAPIAAVICG